MNKINIEILNHLMKTACKSGVDEDNPYMKLLHIIMDLEYRIKVLETKPDPIPTARFSGIPSAVPVPEEAVRFIAEFDQRARRELPPLEVEEIGFPPVEISNELNEDERLIYSHLVSKGCSWEEAAAIVREMRGITDGK
jgi:hypothetical protein